MQMASLGVAITLHLHQEWLNNVIAILITNKISTIIHRVVPRWRCLVLAIGIGVDVDVGRSLVVVIDVDIDVEFEVISNCVEEVHGLGRSLVLVIGVDVDVEFEVLAFMSNCVQQVTFKHGLLMFPSSVKNIAMV